MESLLENVGEKNRGRRASSAKRLSFARFSREVESDIKDLEKEEDYVAMVGVELYGSKALSNK